MLSLALKIPRRCVWPLLICLAALLRPGAYAHSAAQEMAEAAKNLLAALDTPQRAKAVHPFGDDERFDWHFVPKPRKGLPLKEMLPSQRALAHALLSSGLGQRGFLKATTIMSLEQVLFDIENKAPRRDAELYYFTIFGQPGSEAWGWRAEGHHLSLNFAVTETEVISVTPSFFGSNPARVLEGPRKGLRALGQEEDLARAFIKSLNPGQLRSALITNVAPRDIITSNDRKARVLEPRGIAASALEPAQKEKLMALLAEYAARYRPEYAQTTLEAIRKAGEADLHFAWAGGLEPGEGHYYRIQGAKFLIEYDNTQNDNNHIHTVWRDLAKDFGTDLLREHYEKVPHPK